MSQKAIVLWQVLFLFTSMSWLLAPALNHHLSYRITLISQYETVGQPYAWLFRVSDIVAAGLLLWIAWYHGRRVLQRHTSLLLLIVAGGLLLDAIFATSCQISHHVCHEQLTLPSVLHAIESVITAFALFALTLKDARTRRELVSIAMVVFQVAYGVLFLTQFSSHQHFNTLTQYLYQCTTMLWLAWFCRERLAAPSGLAITKRASVVRLGIAIWAFVNGGLALIPSLTVTHHLADRIQSLYFANDTAWLAQHSVIVGVLLLYLARHIWRGEQRARQLFLVIAALETLHYALITPHMGLLGLYAATFVLLFVTEGDFRRGATPLTWRLRVADLGYLIASLLAVVLIAFLVIDHNSHASVVVTRTFDHFYDYVFTITPMRGRHLESILLAHTITAFIAVACGAVLWILFRPSRPLSQGPADYKAAREVLQTYSDSSEDYFKLWPQDKQYFWNAQRSTFIAYKVVGPVAFALTGPVGPQSQHNKLLEEFIGWARSQRLRTCFLPVSQKQLGLYQGLNSVQIGASAVIAVEHFLTSTARDKWWRWKQNRAQKQGYHYMLSPPPHSATLINAVKSVSDNWLTHGGHEERGFALGYFDEAYLQQSTLHYLQDDAGSIVAFVNQLPECKRLDTTTIDLLRYTQAADDAMPYLLAQVIAAARDEGYKYFDLGFVPFAATKGQIVKIAAILSAGRFSAKGLERFKNKFDPNWQPCYLVYDGDLADLALIALHLDRAMNV